MNCRLVTAAALVLASLFLLIACAREPAIVEPLLAAPFSREASPRPTRVAILNFGSPGTREGKAGDRVGIQITAATWRDAIPLLEADDVDVVVIRVNASDGFMSEVESFHRVLDGYEKRWRTVVWAENAISAGCMAAWVVPEWYFFPAGLAGECVIHIDFMAHTFHIPHPHLPDQLAVMDAASNKAGRDPQITRSMQIHELLSCNIDENGSVTWFQNTSGKYLVNPPDRILTFNAIDAQKFRFSKGTAATPAELARCMSLNSPSWVGGAAAKLIDESMVTNREAADRWSVAFEKYTTAIKAAIALKDKQSRDRRLIEVGIARRYLNDLEKLFKANPALANFASPDDFERQRDSLKKLAN